MKLIDILVMISKGELKEGTKIKLHSLDDDEYILSEYRGLVDKYGNDVFESYNFHILNTEVELIEPDHFTDVGKMTEKIEELLADEINGKSLAEAISIIGGKLNEVIRRINNERL